MEIREISFFKTFQCAGGNCSETCCRGWIIPLEKEDVDRLKKERGRLGLRIFLATFGGLKENFNSNSKYCPFFNEEGLCSMQLAKGHDFIPEACRSYPRYYRNHGYFEEQMIDLSCIEGAKLWFANCFDLSFRTYDGEPESGRYGSNEDEAFLRSLESVRSEMCDALLRVETVEELNRLFWKIDAYGEAAQKAFLNEENDHLRRHPFSAMPAEAAPDGGASNDAPADRTGYAKSRFLPFDAEIFEKMMRMHLFSERLAVANPTLYKLCNLYFDMERSTKDLHAHWRKLSASFLERYARYVPYYAALYAYYLYQHFLNIYDDYSFRRNLRMGLIHLNMKFLFDVLLEAKTGTFTEDDFVRTTAVYNRRAYFNGTIRDEIYRVLETLTTQGSAVSE